MDDTTADGLRKLFDATVTFTDEELVLVCAVRFLVALDAAGIPLPVREKDAVMRGVATYMRRQEPR